MTAISLKLNNVLHTIKDSDFEPSVTLAEYIREVANLTGTKVSCGEGGCGACIVTVQKPGQEASRSVNSCLVPVLLCQGWSITTVEGLGGKQDGYHPIQTALAGSGGSQCGYCSPGMVMQLHSWLGEHPDSTMSDLENILDGNLCRCTGYRPILDAVKSFASDFPRQKCAIEDIEDLHKGCKGGFKESCSITANHIQAATKSSPGMNWYMPSTLTELTMILTTIGPDSKYRLVAGNTGSGVYKNDGPYTAYININLIPDLSHIIESPQIIMGANVTITNAINFLRETGNQVWIGVADHLKKIASFGIRNQGTLGGNLMLKNRHNDFPSDVFLSLSTVGVTVEVLNIDGSVETVSVDQFPKFGMERKILTRLLFPSLEIKKKDINTLWRSVNIRATKEWKFRSFKIMPRSSNAHAYVNAGFLALVDINDNFKIVEKPTIVFGGINSTFVHATKTEEFLSGRYMNDHDIFMEALTVLAEELSPDDNPVLASGIYRKQLAMGLFYKFFLYVLGPNASSVVQSGALNLDRGITSGYQDWETDESQWPITQPVEKLEAKMQCAGEAKFVNDIPKKVGELQAAFVLTEYANCDVISVDTSLALAVVGVVDFISIEDIPGVNDWRGSATPEPVFCGDRSEYAGQPVGLIVAETLEQAQKAVKLVQINYANQGDIIVDLLTAMKDPKRVKLMNSPIEYGDVDAAIANATSVISGQFSMGSQYHFHMETHVCLASPTDEGLNVKIPTQDIGALQYAVSENLKIPFNSVNISVARLGGAYGGKIELPKAVACAAGAAALKTRREIRLWLPLEDNMKIFGKRNPYAFEYTIAFDENFKIMGVQSNMFADGGWNYNGVDSAYAAIFGQSCYHIPALKYTPYGVLTNTHSHTWARAPGMVNGHAMLEVMMEHAAAEFDVDPIELRAANLMAKGSPTLPPPTTLETECPVRTMIETVAFSSDFESRKQSVAEFNKANRWKKRGLSMVPMRYDHGMAGRGLNFHCLISIFAGDGTISVTVGGVEMGQGLYTKVAQVVAKNLGVPLKLIKVKATSCLTGPNNSMTGGNWGSESNCMAAMKACTILNTRLAPIKDKLGPEASWEQIATEANNMDINLCASYMMNWDRDGFKNYSVWGIAATEVELDILTGEIRTVRTDILEDAGLPTSPEVDVGQVEGSFIMGLGLWTSEEIKHDSHTGALLTANTWEYKPPAAKDIPEVMRVTLLKNSRNPNGFLSSKAIGEPALLTAISVLFAIRNGLVSSREEAGLRGWWQFNGPATVEKIHQSAAISPDQFIF